MLFFIRCAIKHLRCPDRDRVLSFCLVLLLAGGLVPGGVEASAQQVVMETRASILALDSARTTALRDVDANAMNGAEAEDYRDFIVYLNTRIVFYCRQLQELGNEDALVDLPCPSPEQMVQSEQPAATTPSPQSLPPTERRENVQTRAERTGALEDELRQALGDFDDMLAQEDVLVASRVPSQRETGDGQGAGAGGNHGNRQGGDQTDAAGSGQEVDESQVAGGGGSLANGQEVDEGSAAASSGQGRGGDATTAQEASRHGVAGGTGSPPEDDDIVARQLREAAEKETDPELKKKLWEEYWKYKGERK